MDDINYKTIYFFIFENDQCASINIQTNVNTPELAVRLISVPVTPEIDIIVFREKTNHSV